MAEVELLVFGGGPYCFSGGTMGFATTLSIGGSDGGGTGGSLLDQN